MCVLCLWEVFEISVHVFLGVGCVFWEKFKQRQICHSRIDQLILYVVIFFQNFSRVKNAPPFIGSLKMYV